MENEMVNINEEGLVTEENIDIAVCKDSNNASYVLVGAALAGAAYGICKLGKKVWTKIKANREQKMSELPTVTAEVVDAEVVKE